MATCCICFDIYDQEFAKAFTASCGHSICAQCECKLRIACIKKGIPSQCWTCMKPFNAPLYRTYELESKIPRIEKGRFPNPLMTDEQIRWELKVNPELYVDISLPNYTPPTPPQRQQQQQPQLLPQQSPMRPQIMRPSMPPPQMMMPQATGMMRPPPPGFGPQLSSSHQGGYYVTPNNNNNNRHHPYRPMSSRLLNSMQMMCYQHMPSSYSGDGAPDIRYPQPPLQHFPSQPQIYSYLNQQQQHQQQSSNPMSSIPPTSIMPPPGYSSYNVINSNWQQQSQPQNNNYDSYINN